MATSIAAKGGDATLFQSILCNAPGGKALQQRRIPQRRTERCLSAGCSRPFAYFALRPDFEGTDAACRRLHFSVS